MKTILTLIISCLLFNCYAQEKNFIDQPYLDTSAQIDTLIVPDRIFISISLNEGDNKNKKSTEELEKTLQKTLKELNINTEKDLSLLDYSSAFKGYFLKSQDILKVKNYSLIVPDAVMAGKVFASLEDVGISNVNIEKTEYSKSENLILELKYLAIKKAKSNALKLLEPLNQKIGKAIYITDHSSITNALQGKVNGIQIRGTSSIYGSKAAEPILIDFQKINFQTKVTVKFIIE